MQRMPSDEVHWRSPRRDHHIANPSNEINNALLATLSSPRIMLLSIAGWGRLLNIMFGLTTLIALVCILVGGALARMTWWFWNEARPESPALAPLEIMSDVAYGKADEAQRVVMLDAVRMDSSKNPATKPVKTTVRKPVSRPERTVNSPVDKAPVDNAPRHVIDPLLK